MRHSRVLVGDRDCFFFFFPVGGNGLCVQQPWENISLWSVADGFLSTFSFVLICSSSLSLSHAENEVSRLKTALQPTCQISLFSLPIHFTLGSCFFQSPRKCTSPRAAKPFRLPQFWNKSVSVLFFHCQSLSPTATTAFVLNALFLQAAPWRRADDVDLNFWLPHYTNVSLSGWGVTLHCSAESS